MYLSHTSVRTKIIRNRVYSEEETRKVRFNKWDKKEKVRDNTRKYRNSV